MAIRQRGYLNSIVEQDYPAVKRIVRPMMGFKTEEPAQRTLRHRVDAHLA
jgi:transposase-like protein